MDDLFDRWRNGIDQNSKAYREARDGGKGISHIRIISKARDSLQQGAVVLCVAACYASKVRDFSP